MMMMITLIVSITLFKLTGWCKNNTIMYINNAGHVKKKDIARGNAISMNDGKIGVCRKMKKESDNF